MPLLDWRYLYPPHLCPRRPWRLDRAQLFARVASAHFGLPALVVDDEGGRGPDIPGVYVRVFVTGTSDEKWTTLINSFANFVSIDQVVAPIDQVVALWQRFWVELIPVDDVQLAAEHLAMLEEVALIDASPAAPPRARRRYSNFRW